MSVGKSVNWVGQCIKYELFFPKIHFFLILQLCLAPVFNFFPLSDLNYNLSQISGKIGFFGKNRIFSGKCRNFSIFRRNFFSLFFPWIFFSTPTENRKIAEKSAEISDFFFLAFTSAHLIVPLLALPRKLLSSSIVLSVIQASPCFGSWFLIFLVYFRLSVSHVSLRNILVYRS